MVMCCRYERSRQPVQFGRSLVQRHVALPEDLANEAGEGLLVSAFSCCCCCHWKKIKSTLLCIFTVSLDRPVVSQSPHIGEAAVIASSSYGKHIQVPKTHHKVHFG